MSHHCVPTGWNDPYKEYCINLSFDTLGNDSNVSERIFISEGFMTFGIFVFLKKAVLCQKQV
jgi:hypothetical protein